ncbi:hypothetical protein AB0K09_29860, partial [Streptomyces sp. NPDC049577]
MPLDDRLDDHDDEFARRLSAAMGGAARAFPPPTDDLVNRAAARGRRLRRVRALQIGGAGAALTLVALGGTLLGTGGTGGRAAAPQTVGPAATGASEAPLRPVGAQEMVDTLK